MSAGNTPAETFEQRQLVSDPSDLLYRGEQVARVVGSFGPEGLQIAASKLRGKAPDLGRRIVGKASRLGLEHDLHLRATFSDLWGAVEIFKLGSYDLPSDVAEQVGGAPIVDIGAYNGSSAAYFASHYPDSHVLAIEPSRRNYDLLTVNAAPYGGRIVPVQAAVAAEQGLVRQEDLGARSDDMLHAYVPTDRQDEAAEAVPVLTPHAVLELVGNQEIGILKIDIEGAEKALCESPAIDELLRRAGVLLINTHDIFIKGADATVREAAQRNGLRRVPRVPRKKVSSVPLNRLSDIYLPAGS